MDEPMGCSNVFPSPTIIMCYFMSIYGWNLICVMCLFAFDILLCKLQCIINTDHSIWFSLHADPLTNWEWGGLHLQDFALLQSPFSWRPGTGYTKSIHMVLSHALSVVVFNGNLIISWISVWLQIEIAIEYFFWATNIIFIENILLLEVLGCSLIHNWQAKRIF